MAPIRYSLHYEDYSEHLMSRFGKLLQIQSLVDMTLMCSSHTLRVHKAVLAASSAYFQTLRRLMEPTSFMDTSTTGDKPQAASTYVNRKLVGKARFRQYLYQPNSQLYSRANLQEVLQKQTGEPLIILKMRFSVLKSLVEFMYCGKTQCLEENLDELVAAAQFLKIKGLSKVTKEGLGIANNGELPVFTPPVVINRPPQSLIDLHAQDNGDPKPQSQMVPTSTSGQPMDGLNRPNKDMVVRIPFDIDNGGGTTGGMDYSDTPRVIKPRRGRPSARRGWEGNVALGRAAERALLRREQDSRKAIHQLKHLQTRQMQDYMDRVTLSQAVNSICGPEPVPAHSYMNMDNDLMYMDQTVSSNVLDTSMSYSKDHSLGTETSSIYSNAPSSGNETVTSGISTAMSQYVNALKSAGLPTDLPILFESGDGSYINVNEQVLLDMVQSSEIQYEVIEQPNIIEKVADPTEIKSIDDLSKSIERGEMLMGPKSYPSASSYGKDPNHYNRHEDSMNSLNAILPDNLESFGDQQNYVVLDPQLQERNNSLNHDNTNDFSCIDGDMQFFTKSMGDDVKKYYEDNQLNDSRTMEHFGPASTALDTSFSMSLLDSKISHLNDNMSHQFNSLNHDDLRKTDDCYDFGLQLPHGSDFKVDALDCLMSTPKRNDDTDNDNAVQEREEIIKDLMNIETKMNMACNGDKSEKRNDISIQDFIVDPFNDRVELDTEPTNQVKEIDQEVRNTDEIPDITSSSLQWDSLGSDKDKETSIHKESESQNHENAIDIPESETQVDYQAIIDLTNSNKEKNNQSLTRNETDKENEQPNKDPDMGMPLDEDVPFAVGLLPLKQAQQPAEDYCDSLKRKSPNFLDDSDARCLKRKAKLKKM